MNTQTMMDTNGNFVPATMVSGRRDNISRSRASVLVSETLTFTSADVVALEQGEKELAPQQVLNYKIVDKVFEAGNATYRVSVPIRVVIEVYEGNEVFASTNISRGIAGYGDTPEEALADIFEDFVDAFCSYALEEDSALTSNAIRLKNDLLGHVTKL